MPAETESKTYELAYHLNPELEEKDAKIQSQELFNLIAGKNGSVLSSRGPDRARLSYPIRHKQYSYFGTIDFSAPNEAVEEINARAKLQNNILRFLLIKKPSGGSGLRTLGEHRTERARPRIPGLAKQTDKGQTPAPAEKTEKAGEEIKTEEIEKEIEEVIKGL
jgi:ribosomal protein S6